MRETAGFVAGAAIIVIGVLSMVYPLRWIGIRSRGMAFVIIATGFLVVALAAEMVDSYLVYLGLSLALLGFISLVRPVRFLWIRTRRMAPPFLAWASCWLSQRR